MKNKKHMLLDENLFFCRPTFMITATVVVVLVGLHFQTAGAANIAVTNVTLVSALYAGRVTDVQFDVSWDASWRASWTESTPGATFTGCTNWDAAWIFVKYRCPAGGAANTNWNHASLSTNNSDHTAPASSTIKVGLSTNATVTNFGAGVFLYRSAEGSGSWTNTGVKLRWRYGDDGVASTARVDVCVHAIEMVYVPRGSFYAGDGITTNTTNTTFKMEGQLEDGTNGAPFLVTNDNYIIYLGGGTNGNLGNHNNGGMIYVADDFSNLTTQTLPAEFPKGYNAFYCMKYKNSQGQYADFLAKLTADQATARYAAKSGSSRNTITNLPSYQAGAPTRECNYQSWGDGTAYADWAGLRPITELEYEKICRGPLYPVTNEYSWGTTTYTNVTAFTGTDGSGTEIVSVVSANCNMTGISGPVRCGIFATTTTGRQGAGASYWGILDLTADIGERTVGVGNTTGRAFTGTHGDGKLTDAGDANVPSWPAPTTGAGWRGGYVGGLASYARASDRVMASYKESTARYGSGGFRACRTAPGN